MRRWWAGVAPAVRDRWLAVVVTAAAFVPGLAVLGPQFGDLPRRAGGVHRAAAPDLVVMDSRLPLLDGIEVTRRIAGPEAANPAKVLVVTTFTVDRYVHDALRAGAAGFLLEDAPPAELVDGVRPIARGDRAGRRVGMSVARRSGAFGRASQSRWSLRSLALTPTSSTTTASV